MNPRNFGDTYNFKFLKSRYKRFARSYRSMNPRTFGDTSDVKFLKRRNLTTKQTKYTKKQSRRAGVSRPAVSFLLQDLRAQPRNQTFVIQRELPQQPIGTAGRP